MRIGAMMLQVKPWERLVRDVTTAEELGVDAVYVADHLTHPGLAGGWLGDGWATLAAFAAVTGRVELGSLVSSAAFRNPVPLARAAATVQDVSGGRLVLGLGAGVPHDAAADAGRTRSPARLHARFAEVVEALRAVWDGAEEHVGEQVAFRGLVTRPLPPGTTPPPLLLAAHAPRGLELAGRYADRWNSYGGPVAGKLAGDDLWRVLGEQVEAFGMACEAAGRDPRGVPRSVLVGFGPDRPLASVGSFADHLERADRAGFDEVIFYWPHEDPENRFWADPDVVAEAVTAARR